MTAANLTILSLLDPSNLVDEFVTMVSENFQREAVLAIDHPDKKESIRLELAER